MPDRPLTSSDARVEQPQTDPNITVVPGRDDLASDPQPPTTPLDQPERLNGRAIRPPAPVDRQAPVRTTVHPGVLLDGRYQLQRHISARGDIQLWQGEDQVLARAVAIRLLINNGMPTALEGAAQLLDAARRSGQLVHNGAASTYDATTTSADGLPLAYVISEWVSGVSLLDLLRDAPLQPERAAAIQLAVARVVAAAHEVGVTHGDLHPGDVIITSHGLVKVLDLEMRAAAGERTAAERRSRDVTGLGAILYASLTGRWPLGPGRGLPAAEQDSNGDCRTPRQLRAGVPRELDALAMAALGSTTGGAGGGAGGTAGRTQPTAAEMLDSLLGICAELPTGSQPVLDDDPEADTPAARIARAAQAERVARSNAARQRRVRRRVLPIVILVVLGLVAWLVGVAVDRLPNHSSSGPAIGNQATAPPTSAPLTLAQVTDFDPLGDTVEDPTNVHFSYDGNPQTFWSTENYRGSQWGGSATKTGVGLKIDLGKAVAVSQVQLLFVEAGVTVELRYADVDATSQDAYTVAAQSGPEPKASQTLTPRAGAHRYWLIWLTSLPKRVNPDGTTGYQADLAEIKFFG